MCAIFASLTAANGIGKTVITVSQTILSAFPPPPPCLPLFNLNTHSALLVNPEVLVLVIRSKHKQTQQCFEKMS